MLAQVQRAVDQLEAGTGAQGAHGAAHFPWLAARFAGLHLQEGVALGVVAVGEGVLARVVETLRQLGMFAEVADAGRHGGADQAFGLVVVAVDRYAACQQAALAAQGLDRVGLFQGARRVVAQAETALAAGVFGRGGDFAAVREQHQGLHFFAVLQAPGDAFLRQQPAHEVVVRFAVLAAVAARWDIGQAGARVFAPLPVGVGGVRFEHFVDNFRHRFVLPYAAVAHLGQQPQPGRDAQAVAGEAALAAQQAGLAHVAVKRAAAAVGQAGEEGRRLAEQGAQIDGGAGRERDHFAPGQLLQAVVGQEGFDQEAAAGDLLGFREPQFIQAASAGELGKGGIYLGQEFSPHNLSAWQ